MPETMTNLLHQDKQNTSMTGQIFYLVPFLLVVQRFGASKLI